MSALLEVDPAVVDVEIVESKGRQQSRDGGA
jgi:hypothetical protein